MDQFIHQSINQSMDEKGTVLCCSFTKHNKSFNVQIKDENLELRLIHYCLDFLYFECRGKKTKWSGCNEPRPNKGNGCSEYVPVSNADDGR